MTLLLFVACMADDVNVDVSVGDGSGGGGGGSTDTDTGGGAEGLVGDWLSTGDDLSDLFAPYFSELTAHFAADGTYTASATGTTGHVYDFAGTYVDDTSTSPASITLSQTSPSAATALGIYAVDGDTLTYEVAQTEPDQGYTPPTPESGFGSTSGPSIDAGVNVQTYRRQ